MASIFQIFGEIAINADSANRTIDGTTGKAHGLSKTFEKVGKTVAAGATAAAAAVGVLLKNSIGNYAEYEQLVGGVQTLFKDSSGKVMEYANKAYKEAGMSANKYMETVTGFSASLIQSMGGDTEGAAEVANKALIDMSDNANKMGTSMESIQNAYQGFAKQNYTMLDNLKLGYGGTQSEMKRLLKDAQKISGQKYDIKNFDDIIEAIHVIQEEMGIAGATAYEASETISGSFTAVKSTWTNFVTGLVDGNADMDMLLNNLIDAGKTYAKNIAKVLPDFVKNMRTVALSTWRTFEEAFEGLGDKIPGWISQVQNKISLAWQNKLYPVVQRTFRTTLGVDLPNWETVVASVTAWWNGEGSVYDKLKDALKWTLGEFVEPSTESVVGKIKAWWDSSALPSLTEACQFTFFEIVLPSWADMVDDVSNWWTTEISPELEKIATFKISDVELPSAEEVAIKINSWYEKVTGLISWYKNNDLSKTFTQEELSNTGWKWDEETGQPVRVEPSEDSEANIQSAVSEYNITGEADISASAVSESMIQGQLNGMNLKAEVEIHANVRKFLALLGIPGFASGIDRVPHDMLAVIHKDEAVLRASEAAVWRGEKRGAGTYGSGQVVNVTQNISAVPMSTSELIAETKFALSQMRFST